MGFDFPLLYGVSRVPLSLLSSAAGLGFGLAPEREGTMESSDGQLRPTAHMDRDCGARD